ncbi:hypothetical protein [Caenimonas koreensis]|uniref:hypothetical protein n=1 Tax=Caenimonas koreensis TaxID=367474 RepID=UPI003782EFD9
MKKLALIALVTIASTAAMAQAPAGTTSRQPAEVSPTMSGGAPAAKAQMKTDTKTDAKMMAQSDMTPRMKMMDKNGDGMISQREWNAYHNGMWSKGKKSRGMMSAADADAMISGGPN